MRPRPVLTPTFRNRLRLFFVVIVVVPMVAVALVLFRLVSTSENAKVDARLSQAQRSAQGLYVEDQRRAGSVAKDMAMDAGLQAAISANNATKIQARLNALTAANKARQVRLTLTGLGRFDAGAPPAVAGATTSLVDKDSKPKGRLDVSVRGAEAYADELSTINRVETVVTVNGRVAASTLPETPPTLPARGDIKIGGAPYRVAAFEAEGFAGERVTVRELVADEAQKGLLSTTSLLVMGVLLGFLVLAFAFALTVSRTLQSEIQRLLVAAQRLGSGDFSVAVPAEGNDEFAALGKEFNSMARQLEGRLAELQRERARLQEAIRRVGESFAKGLDRVGLLEIVVQTAVDGIGAAAGRATMRRGQPRSCRSPAARRCAAGRTSGSTRSRAAASRKRSRVPCTPPRRP
jgi:methyl-accepting chemotaxis protein